MSSDALIEAVRRNLRAADIVEFEGLPAGPRVTDSDAIIVVEGRADVLTLLRYGIKNAIAVEGTDVPDAVAELTRSRTVTTFLDGDRGGDLILKELDQVGTVDYVTFAPAGRSVEDLTREEVLSALRKKAPYDQLSGSGSLRDAFAGETQPTDPPDGQRDAGTTTDGLGPARAAGTSETATDTESAAGETEADSAGTLPNGGVATDRPSEAEAPSGDASDAATQSPTESEDVIDGEETTEQPVTLAGHVDALDGSGLVRLLDGDCGVLDETAAGDAFDALESASEVPRTVVIDGALSQRVLDVAAQRGVREIVAADTDEFVKQPTGVRVRLAADV
jgi:DNA primase